MTNRPRPVPAREDRGKGAGWGVTRFLEGPGFLGLSFGRLTPRTILVGRRGSLKGSLERAPRSKDEPEGLPHGPFG